MGSLMQPVKVLYILGVPRSGSTILDRILGSHSRLTSVGELINLPVNGWANNEYCSCGSRANACAFWSEIKTAWLNESSLNNIDDYMVLESKLDSLWLRFKSFEIPDDFMDDFNKYSKMTLSLYRVIQQISKKPVIVDSSKNPLRAYLLSQIQGIDLRVIHLVRDARGVAWSKKKSFKKDEKAGVQVDFKSSPIWRTAINWCRINMRCNWVRKQLNNKSSIIVCYEDFVKQPDKYLSNISQLIDEDLSSLIIALSNDEISAGGHIIAGNRLRMSSSVKLRIDSEWRTKLSFFEKSFVWLITSWLLYSYKFAC